MLRGFEEFVRLLLYVLWVFSWVSRDRIASWWRAWILELKVGFKFGFVIF